MRLTEELFVTVDLGTTGSKVAITNSSGNILDCGYYETSISYSEDGKVFQDPDAFLDTALCGVKNLLEKNSSTFDAKQIVAIGFTGQMGGIIGIDKDFNNITGYDSALDVRSQKYINQLTHEFGDDFFPITSGYPIHAPKAMWWKNNERQTYQKITSFIPLTSYITGKCCGLKAEEAFYDYTHLSFSGISTMKDLIWSDDLIHLFGLDAEKFPRILKPWDIVGKLKKEYADKAGLSWGIPLIAGAGDQPACFLGAGIVEEGQLINVAGSTSVFSACSSSFVPDRERRIVYMHSVFNDLYYPFSNVSGGGVNLRWFKENLFRDSSGHSYNDYDTATQGICPGSNGLFFIPHFAGQISPNIPSMNGSWVGLKWSHTKEHLYKSMLESIAFECLLGLKAFQQMFPNANFESVRITGGGTKSKVWNQIKADVLGLPVKPLVDQESGLRGMGQIAAFGVGLIDNLRKVSTETVHEMLCVYPEQNNHRLYREIFERYMEILSIYQKIYI